MDAETERQLRRLEELDRSRDDLLLSMAETMVLLTKIRCAENPWWALTHNVSSALGRLMAKAERFAENASLDTKLRE